MTHIEISLLVANKKGLHARPAAMLVQLISKFSSQVTICHDDQRINGRSIMGILTLGAQHGVSLNFIIDGDDAKQLTEALTVFMAKQEEEMTL